MPDFNGSVEARGYKHNPSISLSTLNRPRPAVSAEHIMWTHHSSGNVPAAPPYIAVVSRVGGRAIAYRTDLKALSTVRTGQLL